LNKAKITAILMLDDEQVGDRPIYITTESKGVFKSTDGGKVWQSLGLPNRDLRALAVSAGRIYAVSAPPFAGVYFSEDEGKNWSKSAAGNLPENVDIRSISLDPTNPQLVYIGTAPAPLRRGHDYGRVKVSRDGGRTWNNLPADSWSETVSSGQPSPYRAINFVVAAPSQRVWISDGQNIYRLTPQREGWQLVNNGLQGGRIYGLVTDPQVPEVLYAASESGFYRNIDGTNWVKIDKGNTELAPMLQPKTGIKQSASPALVPVNTRNSANSINGLSSTLLYALNYDGWFVKFENREFGKDLVARLPGASNALPDFTAWGGVNPADPVPPPDPNVNDPNRVYFPETGHYVSSGIKTFFERNGGVAVFGYPITEEFSEVNFVENITRTVQYFQRFRIEYHPNEVVNKRVKIGLLGRDFTADRYFVPARFIPTTRDRTYFPQTRHTLSFGIRSFWQANGGLERFGYPLSEEFDERGSDGRLIRVQYFERAKIQYFPDTKSFGVALLGLEYLIKKGWIRP
jgi:hypothetical protein